MAATTRDHPYITSAYFWTFSDPPTPPTQGVKSAILRPTYQSFRVTSLEQLSVAEFSGVCKAKGL